MRVIISLVLILTTILLLALCWFNSNVEDIYGNDWIIGKSREEIEKKYGTLDSYSIEHNIEGEKIFIGIYYLADESEIPFLGQSYAEDLYIKFDENEIARAFYTEWFGVQWGG